MMCVKECLYTFLLQINQIMRICIHLKFMHWADIHYWRQTFELGSWSCKANSRKPIQIHYEFPVFFRRMFYIHQNKFIRNKNRNNELHKQTREETYRAWHDVPFPIISPGAYSKPDWSSMQCAGVSVFLVIHMRYQQNAPLPHFTPNNDIILMLIEVTIGLLVCSPNLYKIGCSHLQNQSVFLNT